MSGLDIALSSELRDALGEAVVLLPTPANVHYGRDWLDRYTPDPGAIVFPRTREEVVEVVRICSRHHQAIVPSGGRTGLSGGAAAIAGEVVLSLEKLNTIHSVNVADQSLSCDAGATLEQVQGAARDHSLYFPIDFASRGSSQIGGNIATNAGGMHCLRYGNIRNWVLGLTAVTADGTVLELGRGLRKDQTGYDLKSLLIGSEGTLAVIVSAILRLCKPPGALQTVLCALDRPQSLLTMLESLPTGARHLHKFEYIHRAALKKVLEHRERPDPFDSEYSDYLLFEIELGGSDEQSLEDSLSDLLEQGVIKDAVFAQSSSQASNLRDYRELVSEVFSAHYNVHKNDIAVPVRLVAELIDRIPDCIAKVSPDVEVMMYGHAGDGNIHISLLKPEYMSAEEFWDACKLSDGELFRLVQSLQGSISAEHGIGLLKKSLLHYSRSATEIALMKATKAVFDPDGILNPGKIFD